MTDYSDPLSYADERGRLPVMAQPCLVSGVLVFYCPAIADQDGPLREVMCPDIPMGQMFGYGLRSRVYTLTWQGTGAERAATLMVLDPEQDGTLRHLHGADAIERLQHAAIAYEYGRRSPAERGEVSRYTEMTIARQISRDLDALTERDN